MPKVPQHLNMGRL